MGISGAGKTIVGEAISKSLHIPFLDADDFQPKGNIRKISSGISLNDDDHWTWLASIVEHILNAHRSEFILSCSALKQSYRDYLSQRLTIDLVYLKTSEEEALRHLADRKPQTLQQLLVQSQLAILEEPKDAIIVNTENSVDKILEEIEGRLKSR
ncbi:hypothetical protein AWN68_16735 [Roseivirga echinicomitans]|uniref:Gluconokinase n=2 Tax=Roseivirga echinicomitans TaxID=296218 RepID=A0A150XPW3_9BACT|nr:hypothetical protein AWN68_16735 [Roseivirga echinicomitans]